MTKINHPDYTSVASSEQPEPPVVQGFVVGDNYVQVTVDKKNEKKKWYSNSKNSRSFGLENDPFFHKSRKPMTLAFCPNCSAENVRTRYVVLWFHGFFILLSIFLTSHYLSIY
jgi:hypothetical protein